MDSDTQPANNDGQNPATPPNEQPAEPAPAENQPAAPAPEPPSAVTDVPAVASPVETPASPLDEPPPEQPTDAPAEPTGPNHPKKVLLVEDDDNLASVYEMRLQAEGFEVHRVPNGEDALASALQFKPDLILLDVMMPKVSGFDVLDILRNTPETANIRIVMLTALGQEADQQRAKDLGVDDYLVKSQVVLADVVERIKSHLDM